jgi:hypothetical protein
MSAQPGLRSALFRPTYGIVGACLAAGVLGALAALALGVAAQVASREDSPVHRGVFVRRALELIEGGAVDASEVTLPRLVSLTS